MVADQDVYMVLAAEDRFRVFAGGGMCYVTSSAGFVICLSALGPD